MRSQFVTWSQTISLHRGMCRRKSPGRASINRIHQRVRPGQKAREDSMASLTTSHGRPRFVHCHEAPSKDERSVMIRLMLSATVVRFANFLAGLGMLLCCVAEANGGGNPCHR